MNRNALALVAGLLGAIVGVVATLLIAMAGAASPSGGPDETAMASITERLDRLEASLGAPTATPTLRGASAPIGVSPAGRTPAEVDALLAQLEERLKPAIDEQVKASIAEAAPKRPAVKPRPAKKTMSLADAAAEIGLSGEQEENVRRIVQKTTAGLLKILAGKDGNVDDIRRELEDAKIDPSKREALVEKYLPRVMTNFGPVMAVMMTHEQQMKKAVGSKNANRLKQDFEIPDLDPLGLETTFDFD